MFAIASGVSCGALGHRRWIEQKKQKAEREREREREWGNESYRVPGVNGRGAALLPAGSPRLSHSLSL